MEVGRRRYGFVVIDGRVREGCLIVVDWPTIIQEIMRAGVAVGFFGKMPRSKLDQSSGSYLPLDAVRRYCLLCLSSIFVSPVFAGGCGFYKMNGFFCI